MELVDTLHLSAQPISAIVGLGNLIPPSTPFGPIVGRPSLWYNSSPLIQLQIVMSFVARQGLRAARALPMAPLARQQARMLHVENVVDQ